MRKAAELPPLLLQHLLEVSVRMTSVMLYHRFVGAHYNDPATFDSGIGSSRTRNLWATRPYADHTEDWARSGLARHRTHWMR